MECGLTVSVRFTRPTTSRLHNLQARVGGGGLLLRVGPCELWWVVYGDEGDGKVVESGIARGHFFAGGDFGFELRLSAEVLGTVLAAAILFSCRDCTAYLPRRYCFLAATIMELLLDVGESDFQQCQKRLGTLKGMSGTVGTFVVLWC